MCRPIAELDIRVAAWRALDRRRPARGGPDGDKPDEPHPQLVCAVRTDVAPDAPEGTTDPPSWRRVDDLPVTAGTWRLMLRRTARRERIRTFLIPPTYDEAGDLSGQVVARFQAALRWCGARSRDRRG